MLDKWEADFDGEPWRLDGKVQSVLDRDLMNWARESEKTWKEKTHASGDMMGSEYDDKDGNPLAGDAILPDDMVSGQRGAARTRLIMDNGGTCFATPNLDGPFSLGELKRCELQRNGAGPRAGHCKWCDRALGDSAEERWDRRTQAMLAKAA